MPLTSLAADAISLYNLQPCLTAATAPFANAKRVIGSIYLYRYFVVEKQHDKP
jgi:hypothetical protein